MEIEGNSEFRLRDLTIPLSKILFPHIE